MAPKTLSAFLSPLSFPHNPTLFNPNLPQIPTKKRSVVFCRFSHPQKNYDKSPVSDIDLLEGTGAAAPTPGDRFLERHRSFEAAKLILKEKKNNNNKKKKDKPLKVSTAVACCYGCGAPLQTSEVDAPGYVDPETYALVLNFAIFWIFLYKVLYIGTDENMYAQKAFVEMCNMV